MSDENRPRFNIPIPDPSVITDARLVALETQMRREHQTMRELLEHQIETTTKIGAERVITFALRLDSLKEKLDQSIASTARALTIALEAQKEAAQESKQTLANQIHAVEAAMMEIKELIYRGEGQSKGQTDNSAKWMSVAALVAVIIMGIFGAIVPLIHR